MKTKKFLAAALAVMMIAAMLPMSALAADPVARIGDTTYETLAAAITGASDGDTITLAAGTYDFNGIKVGEGVSLTFEGQGIDSTVGTYGNDYNEGYSDGGGVGCYSFDGAGLITFKNMTLTDNYDTAGAMDYSHGFVRAGSMTFENCKFTKTIGSWGKGEVRVINCIFDPDASAEYCLKTYSGTSFYFEGCTFNGNKKGFFNIYRQHTPNTLLPVTVKNCTFNKVADTISKTPIYFYDASSNGGVWSISLEGTMTNVDNKISVNNVSGSWLWGDMKPGSNLTTVAVDNVIVWENGAKAMPPVAQIGTVKYRTIDAAIGAAQNGDTIKLLSDVEMTENITVDKNITIDLAGKKVDTKTFAFNTSGKKIVTGTGIFTSDPSAYITENDKVVEPDTGIYIVCPNTVEVNENNKIVSGTFAFNPAEYAAENSTTVKNNTDPATWTVKAKPAPEDKPDITGVDSDVTTNVADSSKVEVKVEEVKNNENIVVPDDATEDDIKDIVEKINSTEVTGNTDVLSKTADANVADLITSATNDEGKSITITDESAKKALEEADITVEAGDTVTIIVEPYIEYKVVGYDETDNKKTITVNIDAKYAVKATTDPSDMIEETGATQNTVTLSTDNKMEVSEPIELEIDLPEGFVEDGTTTLFVKHTHVDDAGDEMEYIYDGDVKDGTLTFTNPNGFSEFEVSVEDPSAASITDGGATNKYGDLFTAIKKSGGNTIKLRKANTEVITVTTSGTLVFTIDTDGNTFDSDNIRAGMNTEKEVSSEGNVYTFTFTAKTPEDPAIPTVFDNLFKNIRLAMMIYEARIVAIIGAITSLILSIFDIFKGIGD